MSKVNKQPHGARWSAAVLIALGFAAMFAMSGCIIYDDAPDNVQHNPPPPPPPKAHVPHHGGQGHTPPPPSPHHGGHHR